MREFVWRSRDMSRARHGRAGEVSDGCGA